MIGTIRRAAEALVETTRVSFSRATLALFDHAPYPLADTLDHHGDPGLLGPDSVSWRVIADPAAIVGGLRGLLVQAAHPEVVAGVKDHSRYQSDPFGRLSRTSAYVTATTFGSMPEVEEAVERVKRIHQVIHGVSSRGRPYDANDPGYSAWVHNALTESFLNVNQAYAARVLTPHEADRFVYEQTRIGALLGSDPMPTSAPELSAWVAGHPDLAPSEEMAEVVEFLTDPPLSRGVKTAYLVLLQAAVATTPQRIRSILGVEAGPAARAVGRAGVMSLRWALGYSPSWALALARNDRAVPWDLIKHAPPGLTQGGGSEAGHESGGEGGI